MSKLSGPRRPRPRATAAPATRGRGKAPRTKEPRASANSNASRVAASRTASAAIAVPRETTLHIRDHCLCLHVQSAARTLARAFDDAFRPLGLTSGQFSLLASLNRPAPARLGAVAEVLAMDRTTLTAALKPLQRRGLIDMTIDPADRRGRMLALTRAGSALLASAVPIWQRTHAAIEDGLRRADPDLLRRDLRTLSGQPD